MLLSQPNKASITLHGAEGPDALQVVIKASIADIDVEGCGPSQPRFWDNHNRRPLARQSDASNVQTTAYIRNISAPNGCTDMV